MKTQTDAQNTIKANTIKMLVLDVDGVLSNGQLVFDNNGIETKAFNVKDGLGIKLLQSIGIPVAIITGRKSHIVVNRASSLNIKHVIQGREDKGVALANLCQTLNLDMLDCAYMGDDLPDLSALQQVGFATCPQDAHHTIRERVDFVSQFAGGQGAVRELCDFIIQAKGQYNHVLNLFLANQTDA